MHRHDIDKLFHAYDRVLLLPESDMKWNSEILNTFQANIGHSKVIVLLLSNDRGIIKDYVVDYKIVSQNDINMILSCYQLYEFTDKLVIGSVQYPFGRYWENFFSSGALSRSQLIDALVNS